MKREYKTPKIQVVDYSFENNVVASSITCSGSWYVWNTAVGCNKYKYTDVPEDAVIAKAYVLHECDWVSTENKFPTI